MKLYRRLTLGVIALVAAGLLVVSQVPKAAVAQDAASALNEIQSRGYVRIGWAPWFPYAYKDPETGEMAGITADLMADMEEWLGVEVRWVEDSWGTMIAGLQAGKFDLLMPMAITLPRAMAATFTDPFLQFNLGVMVRTPDQGKYPTWQDLDRPDVTITAALGSNTAMWAKRVFREATIMEAKGEPESITAVLTGKADAWASAYETFQKAAPGRDQMVIVPGEPFAYSPTALVVRQGDFLFRDWLNHFLAEERVSGALLEMVREHGLDESSIMK